MQRKFINPDVLAFLKKAAQPHGFVYDAYYKIPPNKRRMCQRTIINAGILADFIDANTANTGNLPLNVPTLTEQAAILVIADTDTLLDNLRFFHFERPQVERLQKIARKILQAVTWDE